MNSGLGHTWAHQGSYAKLYSWMNTDKIYLLFLTNGHQMRQGCTDWSQSCFTDGYLMSPLSQRVDAGGLWLYIYSLTNVISKDLKQTSTYSLGQPLIQTISNPLLKHQVWSTTADNYATWAIWSHQNIARWFHRDLIQEPQNCKTV